MHFGNNLCRISPALGRRNSPAGAARRSYRDEQGQGLVETAIFMILMVLLVAYTVDFGYFFMVAANLTSASRNAAEYSIQGYQSPGQNTLPIAGPVSTQTSVAALAMADLGSLIDSSTETTVEVCSGSVGVSGKITKCSSYGPSGTTYVPNTDPEAPTFYLNRVDVTYQVQPPIPLKFFSFSLVPSLKFHRQVSMRAMD